MQAIKDDRGIWNITGLEHWQVTYSMMTASLKDGIVFKFARYGDGEIYCMNGKIGQNCDNHSYFPNMGAALRQTIIQEPNYMVGIQPLSISHIPEDVNSYFGHFKTLYNADVLHNASIEGCLDKFINALAGRYIILVGPAHLADFFKECVHIVIPNLNCWTQYEHVRQQVAFHVEGINNAVVLLAASMMSEVLISSFEDYPHTFVDIGSVLDPYVGINSRKYHFNLK